MNDMLKDILEMDKKAQAQTAELEEYRRNAIAGLAAKKAAIIEEETAKARESALRHSNKRKAEGEKELEHLKAHDVRVLEKMNTLYAANKDKWINEIVANVTK